MNEQGLHGFRTIGSLLLTIGLQACVMPPTVGADRGAVSLDTNVQQEHATITTKGTLQPLQNTCDQPKYPPLSQRFREEGTVVLTLNVGADGVLSNASIGKSSGYKRLDIAALEFISTCRFPGGVGQSERSVDYPMHFRLPN